MFAQQRGGSAPAAQMREAGRVYRGWIRSADDGADVPNDRGDTFEALERNHLAANRAVFDRRALSLRAVMPPILDQGDLQTCTAHA